MPSPFNLRARFAAAIEQQPPSNSDTVRADSAVPVAGQAGGAGISNQINNLGTVRDAGTAGRPNLNRLMLDDSELIALMRSGVFRRVCELYPAWATRKGWRVVDDSDDVEPLGDDMRRYQVVSKFRQADAWARCFGAGYVWMVTHDDADTLAEPLDASTVTALKALHVLDGREVTPLSWDNDPESPTWGDVLTYAVTPSRPGISSGQNTVHASRLLRFYGDRLPPSAKSRNAKMVDDSVGQVIWDALRNMAQTSAGGARLAQELSVLVFKIDPAKSAGDKRNSLFGTLRLMNLQKSIANAMVIGRDGDVSRLNASTSGFGELSADAQRQLALVTGIPLALLFGEAPAGLNSDGESWWRMWRNTIADYQQFRYLPELQKLAEVMYYASGKEPPAGWSVEFHSLGEMSERERAEVRLLTAQADQIDIMSGVLDPARVATSRYGGNAYAFELQPPTDTTPEDETDPATLAEAEAMLQKLLGRSDRIDAIDAEFRKKRFTVPSGARGNATKAIRWREQHGSAVTGMTETGWRRARQLATEKTVSGQDLIDIAAWGSRHAENAEVAERFADEPWRDNGYIGWLGWGGDSMINYATEVVERNRDSRADNIRLTLSVEE